MTALEDAREAVAKYYAAEHRDTGFSYLAYALAALLEEVERLRAELAQATIRSGKALIRVSELEAERDAAVREMHARELHHFEEEQKSAAAEAKLAEAWWEGVNDQWKHRPIGLRVSEFANPYRTEPVPDTRSNT